VLLKKYNKILFELIIEWTYMIDDRHGESSVLLLEEDDVQGRSQQGLAGAMAPFMVIFFVKKPWSIYIFDLQVA
jgi:hypothetical protein